MGRIVFIRPNQSVHNAGGYVGGRTDAGAQPSITSATSDSADDTFMSGTTTGSIVLGMQGYALATNERCKQVMAQVRVSGPFNAPVDVQWRWGNYDDGDLTPWEGPFTQTTIGWMVGTFHSVWPSNPAVEINNALLAKIQVQFASLNTQGGSTAWVYEEVILLDVVTRPSVNVLGPTGTNPGNTHTPTVTWTPTSFDGETRNKYQVLIYDRAVNANPAFGDASGLVYDSQKTTSTATSHTVPANKALPNGSYRAMVEIAQDFHAADWWSLPDSTDFTISDLIPAPTAVGPTGTLTTSHPNLVATLAKSTFAGATDVRGRWQIATDAGFVTNPFTFDQLPALANSGGVHSYQVNELRLAQRTWFLRAAAVDTNSNAGAYSAPVQFVISHPMTANSRTPNGGILPLGNVNFAWTAATAEPTSTQTAYQIVVQTQAGAAVADTGKVPSTAGTATVNIPTANLLRWQVRLWDDEDVAGPYSAFQNFQVQDVPRVAITAPTNPFNDSQPTVSWTFTASGGRTQASWRLVVTDDLHANVVLYDTGIVAGNATSHDLGDQPNVLINHGQYTFTVSVVDNTGFAGQGIAAGLKLVLPPPNPVTGLIAAVVPLNNQANLFGASGIGSIDYVALTWNPTSQGATFGYYEVQRLTLGADFSQLETIHPIAHITDETVAFFNDFESARTADASVSSVYQVFVYDTIRGLSETSITPVVRVLTDSSCDICLTSNYTPDLSVAYQDHAPYDFTTGDTALVREHRIVGRRKPQMFRAANSDGDVFTRQLVLGANKISDATDAEIGRTVFDPLLARVRDTLAPYICVTDGMGRRWYCGARFQKGHFEAQWANYTADVEFTEVADVPTIVVALSPWATP